MRMPIVLLLVCSLWYSLCQAEPTAPDDSRPTLVVGLIEFPPLSYYDEAGQADGLLVPVLQRIVREAGYEPELRIQPLGRLIQGMQDGSVRVWPGIPGKTGLESLTVVGEEALGQLDVNLYYRTDTPAPEWPADLHGADLIVLSGYDYGPALDRALEAPKNSMRLHPTQSHSAAIGMLLHRRANFLLNYAAPMKHALAQRPDVQLGQQTLTRLPLVLIVSDVGSPAARPLLDALEQAYRNLIERGEIEPLHDFQ